MVAMESSRKPSHQTTMPRAASVRIIRRLSVVLLVHFGARVSVAQTVLVQAGDSARITASPSTQVAIPIIANMTNAGSLRLMSFGGRVSWGASRLQFDSIRSVEGRFLTANRDSVAVGSLTFSSTGSSAISATSPVAWAHFTASGTTGGTRLAITPQFAVSETNASLLSSLQSRGLDVCVTVTGIWGDVTDDGTVNILDAQQIARWAVGLSVSRPSAVRNRGDVNADSQVNIIDAQQIARFSVQLTASVRINSAIYSLPSVTSIFMQPSAVQFVAGGNFLQLLAEPRDSSGASIAGCPEIVWSSSNASIAAISASGLLSGITPGSVTITATSNGVSASLPVKVPISLGETIRNLSSAGGEVLYNVSVPSGTPSLTVRTSGGSGGVYLYLYQGSSPAGTAACSQYASQTALTCAVNAPTAGTWTVRVAPFGSGGFSGVILEVNPALPTMAFGQSVANLSSINGDALYNVTVPSGTPSLTVRTSGGSGGVYLYLYQGSSPAGTAACSQYASQTALTCAVNAPTAGTWTVRVAPFGSRGFSGVNLEVNPALPTVAFGQLVASLSSINGDALYNVSVPAGTPSLTVRTSGGSGSVYLYLHQGNSPAGTAVCGQYATTTAATCAVNFPAAGVWTIRITPFGSGGFTGVNLEVNR